MADEAGTYPPDTIATYQCLTGFEESGIASITCLSENWEMLSLTCTRGNTIVNISFFILI